MLRDAARRRAEGLGSLPGHSPLHAVAGSGRPLIDAFRIAHVELVEWLQEYGYGKYDAYALLGQLAENTVANIVDPAYTVIAKFPKRYLPR